MIVFDDKVTAGGKEFLSGALLIRVNSFIIF
jgi:hypothetical protein